MLQIISQQSTFVPIPDGCFKTRSIFQRARSFFKSFDTCSQDVFKTVGSNFYFQHQWAIPNSKGKGKGRKGKEGKEEINS